MEIVKIKVGSRLNVDIKANVPALKAPPIKSTVVRKGTRMHIGHDGKEYLADMYDKMFTPGKPGKVLPKKLSNPVYSLR